VFKIFQAVFTENEQIILDALSPKYRYIGRTEHGDLFIARDIGKDNSLDEPIYLWMFSSDLFKSIGPNKYVCLRKKLINDKERKYISQVIKPFRHDVKGVKIEAYSSFSSDVWLEILLKDGQSIKFPFFKLGTMYEGMELGKEYTLDELEIYY